MSQSDIYTVFCILLGQKVPFSVKVEKEKTVGHLKYLIKTQRNAFAGIEAGFLDLYHVDFAEDSDLVAKVEAHPLDSELPVTSRLIDIFPATPKGGTIHFIVKPTRPKEAQLRVQGLTSPEFRLHVDAVKFFTESLRSYTVEGLRHDSNNTHLHIAHGVDSSPFPEGRNDHQPPSFVSEYVQKLNEKRPLSQAQLQQLQQIFDQATCEAHFEASGDTELSSIEFSTYNTHIWSHHGNLNDIRGKSSKFKDFHMTAHLVNPALMESGKPWCYNKDVIWGPLLLEGALADREFLYTFQSRSDFFLLYDAYGPLIIGEVNSENNEFDRWRMLFEGAAVCRYQNMLRMSRNVVVLCLYLNKNYKMERYLVYQAGKTAARDVHILHDLTLDLSKVGDAFLLSKQLFNFRDHLSRIPEIDESRKKGAIEVENQIKARFPTSVTAAAKWAAGSTESHPSRPPADVLGHIEMDVVLLGSFKDIYFFERQKKDVAVAVRRSDMQSVVLKRIRTKSSEMSILRLLQSHSLQDSNHIIPLLEVIERPPSISTLVMPYYTSIYFLGNVQAEELALQLIRGVDWLHERLISHCDIKGKNLVFHEKQNRLFIIDFGLAVKLTSRQEKVGGARGTPEHVAPEVGITSYWEDSVEEVVLDEDSIYSPILADVWAVGNVTKYFHQRFKSSAESIQKVIKQVAKELQADEPKERLSLREAERRIVAACSMATTASHPTAASP